MAIVSVLVLAVAVVVASVVGAVVGTGSHLGAILASSWGTWEGFRGHFGRLGANLSQHKAILSHLGANLG